MASARLYHVFFTDPSNMRSFLSVIFFSTVVLSFGQQPGKNRTLIVIFDGLRPDYITAEYMPHVYALKQNGGYGMNHHSVFPTVTRVNASSYATGAYPATHGLMGNTVYFPEVDVRKGLNTGDAKELLRIEEATNGHLLTVASLGEVLAASGSSMMVFSSGSSGQAFLQNHTISGAGMVVNPELILPAAMKEDVYKHVGAPPTSGKPNIKQHDWATRAFLYYGTSQDGPLVSAIWYSDPDGSAHSDGIGSPSAIESIKAVDEQFGYILKTLEAKGLLKSFNIIITADHGFVTDKGTISLQEFLIAKGLKQDANSQDVVVAGGAVYVKDHDPNLIGKIVSALQVEPWVGAIFTDGEREGSLEGSVPGTLSLESIHWNHARSGDILVDYNWDDAENSFGYRGSSFAKGVAGHGSSSPYEIHIPLIVSGPAFRKSYESSVPTSNVDITPTILHLYGLPIPSSMDGRVMEELLTATVTRPRLSTDVEIIKTTVRNPPGTYRIELQRSRVGNHFYVDHTKVTRDKVKR